MKRTLVVAAAAVAVVAYLFVGGRAPRPDAVAADVPAATSGIVVDGTGQTSGTPDVLRATLGVAVHRPDVSSAMAAASSRQAAVRAALVKDGVATADLQTSDVTLSQDYGPRGQVVGYQVTETLTAKLRDLKRAGQAIADAVAAAGNEAVLQGVTFALEDNAALLQKARDAAFAQAQAKAEQYAQLSHRTLGDVQFVSETSSAAAQPIPYAAPAALQSKAIVPVPVDPGSSDVSVTVTVRWALR